ncbi:hypothetical protein PanWU01x14_319050 [Parasponia andersonii]|uniref:Uncharacterized protein n=1 Tax=Parasponia andersonii TaxID=3476 RepID=A0A2P5AM58_PARAD|nr:hypothetical protein PanWU01x14_319050 [Parasponia andersonii]
MGLSGSCMQMEQFKLPPRRSRRSLGLEGPPWASASGSEDGPASSRLHMRRWRLLAFSRSVSEVSDSMARMAATKSEEWWWATGLGLEREEQSGHTHLRASAMVSGREERQVTCHGVAHVLQVSDSSLEGLALHTMQMPSPSQGRSLAAAMVMMVTVVFRFLKLGRERIEF